MKEYEITATYLNGCSGAAWPQTSIHEAELEDPADFIRSRHGREFPRFVREILPDGQLRYSFDNGTVSYIYDFTEV